jgi:hypothetical protein
VGTWAFKPRRLRNASLPPCPAVVRLSKCRLATLETVYGNRYATIVLRLSFYRSKRSATQKLHQRAIRNWNPSDLPAGLTRDVFVKHAQPVLTRVPKAKVRSVLGVGEPYSADMQSGKRIPHPRHWQVFTPSEQLTL